LIEDGIYGQVKQLSLSVYETDSKNGGSKALTERHEYSYSQEGRVMQQLTYNSGGALKSKISYTRNPKTSNVSELKIYDGAGKMTMRYVFTYNSNSKESGHTVYDSSGKIESRIVYEYSDANVRLGGVRYNQKGEIISIEKELYDTENRLIKEVHVTQNREPIFQSILIRDNNGAITIQKLQFAGQKARIRKFKSLRFDNLGSWTERSVYENGKLAEYVVRNMVYY
jgi:hypothetical protein